MHTGHDVAYVNDNLNRLIDAEEGTWGGSSISSRKRHQIWSLNQTGNWNEDKVDLDGDDNWNEAGEWDDTRTHNAVNELSTRDMDSTPGTAGNNYTFAYDAAGNLTDDGESYTYEWDAFYRLRRVKNRSNGALVSEYWFNGLGYLITRHQDTDTDGDVDGSDKKYHSAFDERWRCVATFRDSDSDPKEQFLYQAAGAGGFGGSSYIDAVVLRDRDMTNGWTGAADGALEERFYYAQNWHADVVAVVTDTGTVKESVKYSGYGIPFAMPKGDVDSDGDCDAADDSIVNGWVGVTYDVRGDIDLDDDVDAGDYAAVQAVHQALGRGVLTAIGIGNRKTHAGYELAFVIGPQCHVRQRISSAALGRWHRRDPQGYQDSLSLYELLRSAPANTLDPFGLCVIPCPGYEDRHVSGSGPMCVNATSTWPSNDLMIEVVTNHHKNDCACEDKTPNTHEFCDCELGYSYNNLLITMGPAYQEWQYRPWVLGAPMPPPKLMQCRDITYEFDAFWICTTLCDGGPLVAIARVNNSLSALSASLNGVSY